MKQVIANVKDSVVDTSIPTVCVSAGRCFCIVGLRVNQKELRAGMVKNPCPFYIHSTSLKEVLYAMIIKVTTRNV
jgi:hypothetical protein